jgi:hypothetical protein
MAKTIVAEDLLIPFPVDCDQRVQSYKYTIHCYRQALNHRGRVFVDCNKARFFAPLGLNLLASIVYDLAQKGVQTYFTSPQNHKVRAYLSDQGFYSEFGLADGVDETDGIKPADLVRHRPRSTSIGLKRMDSFEGDYSLRVSHWLNRNSALSTEEIQGVISVPLPEMINNVLDHSQSAIGCYICAQAYPRDGRLLLSVVDLGVGFLSTLQRLYPYLTCEADAIDLAVQPGITSKSTVRNAGAGLDVIRGFLQQYSGEFEIISNNGRWFQDKDGQCAVQTLPFSFPGTSISVVLDNAMILQRLVDGIEYE